MESISCPKNFKNVVNQLIKSLHITFNIIPAHEPVKKARGHQQLSYWPGCITVLLPMTRIMVVRNIYHEKSNSCMLAISSMGTRLILFKSCFPGSFLYPRKLHFYLIQQDNISKILIPDGHITFNDSSMDNRQTDFLHLKMLKLA